MSNFNPKLEIINHFDNLINRVDIDIEECLKKYNDDGQILGKYMNKHRFLGRYVSGGDYPVFTFFNQFQRSHNHDETQTVNLWPESIKVVDYLQQVRQRTIDELRKAQEDTLEYHKSNSTQFDFQTDMKDLDVLKSQLFPEKFYFQVLSKPSRWIFNVVTFVTDFYMSPDDIVLLEKMINADRNKVYPFGRNAILDEKAILIGLIREYFFYNFKTEKVPNHVVFVRKQDVSNIERVQFIYETRRVILTCSSIDLTKLVSLSLYGCELGGLEEMRLENFCALKSVHLKLNSFKSISLKNMRSVQNLSLHLNLSPIDSEIQSTVFDHLPNIETLTLDAPSFSKFNLESLVNLKSLSLSGNVDNDFNFDLFKNLCNQLEDLAICIDNINDRMISDLFYSNTFSNLESIAIRSSKMTRLEKKLFDGFPMLRSFRMSLNSLMRRIDHDAFLTVKKLRCLYISEGFIESLDKRLFTELVNLAELYIVKNRLKTIEENIFSNLSNLIRLDLSNNQLVTLRLRSFFGLRNLKQLNLEDNQLRDFDLNILGNMDEIYKINLKRNPISNKEEFSKRLKDSKIKFKI